MSGSGHLARSHRNQDRQEWNLSTATGWQDLHVSQVAPGSAVDDTSDVPNSHSASEAKKNQLKFFSKMTVRQGQLKPREWNQKRIYQAAISRYSTYGMSRPSHLAVHLPPAAFWNGRPPQIPFQCVQSVVVIISSGQTIWHLVDRSGKANADMAQHG